MDIVYATTNAVIPSPLGHSLFVQQGQHWPASDPLVLARPDLFSSNPLYGISFSVPPPGFAQGPLEAATANPGERRPASARGEDDDLDSLRAQATAAGIKVDGRWSAQRIREEIASARA